MMNRSLLIILLFALPLIVKAQTINTSFTIKTNQSGHKSISPYIYGCNDNINGRFINATSRRLGGNRLTGYNWENNASNCGKDCGANGWNNDGYLVQSLPSGQRNIPGMTQTAFHDTSLAMNPNMYTLLTLQVAGYVAKDKNGSVLLSETAPSPRFDKVVYKKPAAAGAFVLTPDLADDSVYMDEFANFIKNKYGAANTPTGVKGYSLDNEPALWSSTHARIHPSNVGCTELLLNSIALSKAVKTVDPSVEVFGPVFYSYSDLGSLGGCNDWNNFSGSYTNFLEAYIDQMSSYSPSKNLQLLDVIDFHWYPEARDAPSPAGQRISFGGGNSKSVAMARIQAPRSLWDPTYSEISWIAGPINLLNKTIFKAINSYPIDKTIPRTKVSFTEYEYGGYYHISGGIAQADVLGIFGKNGVYMANVWPTSTTSPGGIGTSYNVSANSHLVSAFKLYRNYDGRNSTFGSVSVTSTTSDIVNSSIYTSIKSPTDSSQLHMIVLNKNYDNPMKCTFNLATKQIYKSIKIYTFDSLSAVITYKDSIRLTPNTPSFTYTLPKLTAAHFVLDTADVNSSLVAALDLAIASPKFINVYPNPFDNSAIVEFNIPSNAHVILELTDILGKIIRTVTDQKMTEGNHSVVIEKNNLPAGVYFCKLSVDGQSAVTKLVVN